MHPPRWLFLGFLVMFPASSPARAQERLPPARLIVDSEDGSATLLLSDLLADPEMVDALHSGLPLRIHIETELWKDRFFDSQEGVVEWRASVTYDPLERRYHVTAAESPAVDLAVVSLEEVRAQLGQSLPIAVRPTTPGRYYYLTTVELETLSLSDLQELERWLQGELAPVVREEQDMESAVERGLKRVFVRALGLPALRFRVRTDAFEYPGRDR